MECSLKWVANVHHSVLDRYILEESEIREPEPTDGRGVDELIAIGLVGVYVDKADSRWD